MQMDLKPFMTSSQHATQNNGFFLTLDWPQDSVITKYSIGRDLEKFAKLLRRDYCDTFLGAVWKKEMKRCDIPHIHVIALFDEMLLTEEIREWAENTWTEVVGPLEPYAVNVMPLYGIPEQLINYLLKQGYDNAGALCIGRVWGKWNRKGLPLVEPEVFGLSKEDYKELIERLKAIPQAAYSKVLKKLNPEWKGARVVGNGDSLRKLLDGLPSESIDF